MCFQPVTSLALPPNKKPTNNALVGGIIEQQRTVASDTIIGQKGTNQVS